MSTPTCAASLVPAASQSHEAPPSSGTPGLKKVNELVCSKRDHSLFVMVLYSTPACAAGGGKNATTHNGGEPFAPGSPRIGFTPIENVWRRLMNMLMSWENKVGKSEKNTKILYKSRAF